MKLNIRKNKQRKIIQNMIKINSKLRNKLLKNN